MARLPLSSVSAACEQPISTLPPLMAEYRSDGCSIFSRGGRRGGQNSGQLFPTDGRIDAMHDITSKLRDGKYLQSDVDGFHVQSDTEREENPLKKSHESAIIRHRCNKLRQLLADQTGALIKQRCRPAATRDFIDSPACLTTTVDIY